MPRVYRRTWTDPKTGRKKVSKWYSLEYERAGVHVNRRVKPLTTFRRVAEMALLRELGGEIEPTAVTVRDVLEAYRSHLDAHSPSSFRSKGPWLNWWDREFGRRSVTSFGLAEVDRAIGELRKTRKPGTVGSYLSVLRSAFNRARRDHIIDAHPVCQLEIRYASPERHVLWSDDDLVKLFRYLPPWAVLLVKILRFTGLRVGDALALRWENVRGDVLVLRQQKTEGDLVLPLTARAKAVIDQIPRRNELVFPNRNDEVRRYRHVLRTFHAARDQAGIVGKTIHDLRRSFADELLNAGVSPAMIAALLGQRSTKLVHFYTKAQLEALRAAAEAPVHAA